MDAWAVQDADPSGAHYPELSLESDRDFHLSASADVEEREDVVKALSHPRRGGLQSAANQPEPEDAPRLALPEEDARQSVALQSHQVAGPALARVAELWGTEPRARAPLASRARPHQ